MKSLVEIPIIGLIGTLTIMVGIIMPPTIIKTTVDREIMFTYNFEKAQQALLTLLSSKHDNIEVYETISTKVALNQPINLPDVKENFDKTVGTSYCVLVIEETTSEEILSDNVCEADAIFNTVFVIPYNKQSLVRVIGIGLS